MASRLRVDPQNAKAELSRVLKQRTHNRYNSYVERVCILSNDSDNSLQRSSLLMLSYYGPQNDAIAEEIALTHVQTQNPKVRDAAIAALGQGGRPKTISLLFSLAEQGNHIALWAVAKQAHTPVQKEQLVELARALILSDSFQVAWNALYILRQYITAIFHT